VTLAHGAPASQLEVARPPAERRRFAAREVLHQAYLCMVGLYHLVRHPESRETFTALSEALVRFRANQDAVDHMLRDPATAELCRERYTGRKHTPAELIEYPEGSLGHELAAAMIEHGYDPEFYRDYYGDTTPRFRNDEEYLRFRVRQTHDILHILTGFSMTEFPGELGMQAFIAAQTRRPFCIALVGLGLIRILLKPSELPRTLHQVGKGFAMGYRASTFVGHRFEEDWAKPVDAWRSELGLVPEPAFDFRTDGGDRVGESTQEGRGAEW
jgi:ubiquinone biosynthesis protein COQ4